MDEAAGPWCVLPLVRDEVRRGPVRVRRVGLPAQGGHPPTLDARALEKRAPEATRLLLSHLSGRGPGCDVISLRHLSASSFLLKFLPAACEELGLLWSLYPARREAYLNLHGDWDSFLDSLKGDHRRLVRRRLRRIEEQGQWRFEHEWPGVEEVERVHRRYLSVVSRSWKRGELEDDGFVELLRRLMVGFARRGDLLVSWLRGPTADGACLLQFRQGKVVSGFHQAYAEDCPVKGAGTLLLGHAVRYAFETGVGVYDFATYAEHIQRWNPAFKNSFHVYVTRRSLKGFLIQRKLKRIHRSRTVSEVSGEG